MEFNAIFLTVSVVAVCATVVLITLIRMKDSRDRREWCDKRAERFGETAKAIANTIVEAKVKLEAAKAEKAPEDSGK